MMSNFYASPRQLLLLALATTGLTAQDLGSLKKIPVPQPAGASQYIQDQTALVALGKALFWDMQAGSDGRTACASCHFHAGADHRAQNQLSNPNGTLTVNLTLAESDFPFHVFSNPASNRSNVVRDTTAVAGSAGVLARFFADVIPGAAAELGGDLTTASPFNLGGLNTRQVTGRNAPSVINAVFNVRNFWDGRASDVFTGATPFGDSDTAPRVLDASGGIPTLKTVRIAQASLASQAVGPALSSAEMAYAGKTWPQMGKKMLSLRPLALQQVALDDSVLGSLRDASGPGLNAATYLTLIQVAFSPAYWNSDQLVDITGNPLGRSGPPANTAEFTVAEFNFGLFWGLAIHAYESILVSDDSRVDQFFDGVTDALTAQERAGLDVFQGRGGQCNTCHAGAELTLASYTAFKQTGQFQTGGRAGGAGVDTGFFRTGVRPIAEDTALGASDGFGLPLSRALIAKRVTAKEVSGLFKVPALRNVEFTGPYQHNGGQATLEQVVEFYSRGGDFPADGNLGPGIEPHNLSAADQASLVAFLKAMTDDRVRFERAPFDHPELCVPVGAVQLDSRTLVQDTSNPQFTASALERWAGLPAVGKNGNTSPLQTFQELLNGTGADGSRAHSLQDACSIAPNNIYPASAQSNSSGS